MPVSFDTSVTNENVAPEDEGDEDENKRKFHARPTPYPKKKLRSIEEDDDSDTVPPIQTGVAPSSRTILFGGIGVAGGGDSEKEEEAIEKQKDAEEETDDAFSIDSENTVAMRPPDNSNNNSDGWWEKATADILKDTDSIYCENLQKFQEQGLDRRAAVRDRLSFVMEDIKTKLDEITERTTNVLAAQLYDNYASTIQAQENKILQLVRSNHASRVRMVEALEKANLNWESKYSNLMNRIIYAADNKNEESSMDNPKDGGATDSPDISTEMLDGNAKDKDNKESPSPLIATKDDSLNSESQDPDWDEVIRFAPHCEENIRSFLEVREKWKAVESRYIQAIESSHERLQANIMKTIHTVYETFQGFDERMDEQQYDIQKLMANNHERRQKLQQALEESALQAKSLFARLMARVSSIRAPGRHS